MASAEREEEREEPSGGYWVVPVRARREANGAKPRGLIRSAITIQTASEVATWPH
jgi:hypothetical protein